MSKRKIIIITRDGDYNSTNTRIGSLLKNNSTQITQSYLGLFEYVKSQFLNETSLDEFLESQTTDQLPELIELLSPSIKNSSQKSWYPIPNDLIMYHNDSDISLYSKIQDEDDEIFLLFYNRTKESINENPALLLSLVCMDCGITDDGDTNNMLYIHDRQWGMGNKQNELLVYNGEIVSSSNIPLLQELKKRNFTFVATFQHEKGRGRFYDHILNCKFGKKQTADVCEEYENNPSIPDFIQLKLEINNNLYDTSQI